MSGEQRGPGLSSDASLCKDIDRMISVSRRSDCRPIFPVHDAAVILMQRHRLTAAQRQELLVLISQRCIGKHVPLSFDDFGRIGPL